jgi:hypothetical protein
MHVAGVFRSHAWAFQSVPHRRGNLPVTISDSTRSYSFFLFEIVVPRYSRYVIAVCSHGYANPMRVDEITQISSGIAERKRSVRAGCSRLIGE